MTGKKLNWKYVEEARKGDHICYISDLRKFQSHYPNWSITRDLDTIFREIIAAQQAALGSVAAG
jgi:CDP-paratose 2-epimerase